MARSLICFAFILVSACAADQTAGPELVELCRPNNMPDRDLRIGNIDVAPGSYSVRLSVDPSYGQYGVQISLSEEDASRLMMLTRNQLNEVLPIRVGDETVFEPTVRTPILDGRVLISGGLTRVGAEEIVKQLSPPCLRLSPVENPDELASAETSQTVRE